MTQIESPQRLIYRKCSHWHISYFSTHPVFIPSEKLLERSRKIHISYPRKCLWTFLKIYKWSYFMTHKSPFLGLTTAIRRTHVERFLKISTNLKSATIETYMDSHCLTHRIKLEKHILNVTCRISDQNGALNLWTLTLSQKLL